MKPAVNTSEVSQFRIEELEQRLEMGHWKFFVNAKLVDGSASMNAGAAYTPQW